MSARTLTRREFLDAYYYRHRPVIVTDAIDEWPARRWTPETLEALLGDREITVRVSDSGLLFDNSTGESRLERMRLHEFVGALGTGGTRKMYFAQQSLKAIVPDHARHVPRFRFLRATDTLQAANLWFGDAGCVTPLHFDFVHNYFAQLYGRKEFVIFAPEDRPYLYPNRDVPNFYFVSKVSPLAPDPVAFPEFARATPIRFVLEPSDVLFLPCGWWHLVRSLDVSISVNQWWVRVFSRNTKQARLLAEFLGGFVAGAVRGRGRGPARHSETVGRY